MLIYYIGNSLVDIDMMGGFLSIVHSSYVEEPNLLCREVHAIKPFSRTDSMDVFPQLGIAYDKMGLLLLSVAGA